MKSKKYLVTSIATATLGLALLTDTAGMSPFSIQQVSAQEKSTPKNGNVKENNLPKQTEKPKDNVPKQSEKPKSSAPKQSDKQKNTEPKQDKPKSKVQSGWVGSSYYQNGVKVTNKWIFDKKVNSYFYLNASGNYVQNAWVGNYYLKSDGKRAKNEWIYDKKSSAHYYLTAEGSYARNTWVGSYYLKSDGKRAKNEWIYDKNSGSYFYQTAEGSSARNTWVGNYYLKSDGKRVKSDWIYDKNSGSYYYLTAEGSIARNKWIGNYYLKSDGKMAKNEWVDGGRYYVESDGKMARDKWVDGSRYYVGNNGVRQQKPAVGNQNNAALIEAKKYNSYLHMSKKELYDQLTSQVSHGFSSSAAQYAIDHLNADYKANALVKAREYRKYSNLSKTEIYNRLTSPWIGKFTKEEANYAIQKLDLTPEGSIARNKWVGYYYYKSDGKVAKNEWVDGGRYYVDPNGLWLPKSTDGDPYAAALNEAKSYNRIHLSKKRIYKTLILFGFNSDVAQYTIDHLYADYKANALATARNNRKYSKLSKTEIYERLVSSSYFNGEFTKEEANYAIQHLDD